MSKERKKEKVIHVDKLVIHAKKVELIDEDKDKKRDPWDFFWGRPRPLEESEPVSEEGSPENE